MELYKLYCILKRHTGFNEMWRIQRKLIMPEWYEEKHKQAMLAVRRLSLAYFGIKSRFGSSEYFLERM